MYFIIPIVILKQMISTYEEAILMSSIELQITNKEIYLNKSNINDDRVKYICSQKTQYITLVLIGWNGITNIGMSHFPKANWSNLKYLSLWQNNIGAKGCKYLSRAAFHQLQHLNLNANQIQNQGAIHIYKLKTPIILKIQLQNNRFGTQSMGYIARANWKKLEHLTLYKNFIENEEAPYVLLAKFMLKSIKLCENKISEQKKYALTKAIPQKFAKIKADL